MAWHALKVYWARISGAINVQMSPRTLQESDECIGISNALAAISAVMRPSTQYKTLSNMMLQAAIVR